jgi:glyoxylate/hydroxypyruvate reductase A
MALLLTPVFGPPDEWRALIAAEMPDLDVRIWPDVGDRGDIEVAAIAGIPRGTLKTLPNLRLIVSLTAGVDRLLGDPELPDVPIARAAEPGGDAMIDEFALLHVLRHHRELPELALAQQKTEWVRLKPKHAHERPVGVMGLGAIGLSVAQTLKRHGFDVAGWVRTPRQLDGITLFHGRRQLPAFLARSEIVVNLLPLTAETKGMLNAAVFAQLPKGAAVINLGRGPHVNETDLMEALDAGHLSAATLDVFPVEPLPSDSPLWRHPRITVTPHVSRRIYPNNLAPRVCEVIRRWRAGGPLPYAVDRKRGY